LNAQRPLTCVSLFSGCGGLDLGIRRAGFEIIFAEDNDSLCAESHRSNFPSTPFHLGSISDLSPELFLEVVGRKPPPIDLLVGGPPCPPYSKSRFYRKDKPRALGDPVGWESITGYLKVLEFTQPKAFLLENVPGLAYTVHADALGLITDTARRLGYEVTSRVLNAADFGVPQIRQRLFVIGTREPFSWPQPSHAENPDPGLFESFEPWVTAGQALGDLDSDENANDAGHFAGGGRHDLLEQVPPGDNYLYFTEKRGHPEPIYEWRSRYWSFLLKLSPDLPAWTIQARRSNNMGPFHWRNRILRISEIKRLQTFPDDWAVSGKVSDQWHQIGNAVPPILAERLGIALRQCLRPGPNTAKVAFAESRET
jgi:DNA (cytosine-5)-methyltransferase 1